MDSIYIKNEDVSVTKIVNMRIEEQLYNLIKKEAIDNGFTIKNLILYSTLSKIKEHKNDSEIYLIDQHNINQLIFQIRKIGVNINQIAKKINSGMTTQLNFDEVMNKLEEIEQMFVEFKNHVRKVK